MKKSTKEKKEKREPIKIKLVEGEGSMCVISRESVYYAKNIKGNRLEGKIYFYK